MLSCDILTPFPRPPVAFVVEEFLWFFGECLAELGLEILCDACFCGLWSDRDAGFDKKPRRKGLP